MNRIEIISSCKWECGVFEGKVLRVCVSKCDSASGDRLLKFLRILRLLRFSECAHRRNAIKLSEICDDFC